MIGHETRHLLPFINDFTGCDSTSRIFGVGKGTVLKKASTSMELKQCDVVFVKDSSIEDIEIAGECAFMTVYGGIDDRE